MSQKSEFALFREVLSESKSRLVRISAAMLFAICFIYIFLWYAFNVPTLSVVCIVMSALTVVLYYYPFFKLPQSWATQGVISIAVFCTYLASVHTWRLSPVVLGYYPVIIVATFLLADKKTAIIWTIVDVLLAATIPTASTYFHADVLPTAFIGTFNLVNVVAMLITTAAVVYTFEKLSRNVIDELIENKAELEETQKNLLDAQQHRNRFFASISHEIRTPMNAVRGISELLLKNADLMRQDGSLVDALHSSSNHLLSVVNDLLDVSKLEVGQLRLMEVDFDLRACIRDAYTMVRYAAIEKKLTFEYEIDSKIPQYVYGDANRLRQIVVNLLNNAVKFTEQGSIRLQCTVRRNQGATDIPLLLIKITDTGIGIAPHMQEKVFEAYIQVDESVNHKYGGTGLGLNICKRIAQHLGGRVWLESVLGQGSTFYVELPLKLPQGALQHVQEKTDRRVERFEHTKPCTVLIVEDNKINVLVAKRLISAQLPQIKYIEAENGAIALKRLEDGDLPDLVLMDVQMPVMDGLEATKHIRAHANQNIAKLYIIAMTANIDQRDIDKCREVGMDDFIPKPIDSQVLLLKIQHFIQEKLN